ncbi:MAG: hypothetical protein KGJ06_08925, partial [Pseudomonadota bacterium]|nr:hypothetical protein [Pseudomonadota bacterium]
MLHQYHLPGLQINVGLSPVGDSQHPLNSTVFTLQWKGSANHAYMLVLPLITAIRHHAEREAGGRQADMPARSLTLLQSKEPPQFKIILPGACKDIEAFALKFLEGFTSRMNKAHAEKRFAEEAKVFKSTYQPTYVFNKINSRTLTGLTQQAIQGNIVGTAM